MSSVRPLLRCHLAAYTASAAVIRIGVVPSPSPPTQVKSPGVQLCSVSQRLSGAKTSSTYTEK